MLTKSKNAIIVSFLHLCNDIIEQEINRKYCHAED